MKMLLCTLNATERLEHIKWITVVVPDDCDYDDLIMLGPDWLDSLTACSDWQVGDSDGMEISGIDVEEADSDDLPDLWLRWGRNGLEEYDPEEDSNATTAEL